MTNSLSEALPLCAIDVAMARLSGLTFQVYGLLETALVSLALGMTHGIISFLNFCTPQQPLKIPVFSS